MTHLQTRALVLLAGNGTVLLFLGSWLIAHPNAIEPSAPPNVNAAPLLVALAMMGVAFSWLTLRDSEKEGSSGWEYFSVGCFAALMVFLLLWLAGQAWFSAVETPAPPKASSPAP
jgi:hypothetical protein